MRIHFHGATRTTTGSMYLLEVNGQRILLECGLYQGRRDESIERNSHFPFDPKTIDAAILSHAHIDHCGNFPNLCKQGFTGNIYATFATRDLASIMLEDSARIQESDAQFLSKKRAKQGKPPIQALYSATDAERTIRQFVGINYDRPMPVADGLTVTFKDAGHILGSAQVVLDVREGARKFRYLFSGDIGRPGQDILRDAQPVEQVDFLQVESTYGNRLHVSPVDARDELASLVGDTIRDGGKVIIPAFSVGRTQQVVYALNQLTDAGKLPPVPIYVDSPLSTNATEIFRLHPECFDEATYAFLREKGNPFGMANLTYIREVASSRKLNELKEPAVILSASGMAEAGRVLHHLKNHGGNPVNLILFVGYCAEHTLGAQIIAGRSPVNIFGEPHAIRARVAKIDAFSGHADKHELSAYVKSLTGHIKKTFIVHGEEEQALPFADTLKHLLPKSEITVPVLHQAVEV